MKNQLYRIALLAMIVGSGFAETIDWIDNATGTWSTPGNWVGGALPGAGDDVRLRRNAMVTLNTAQRINKLDVGIWNDGEPAALTLATGASLSTANKVWVGSKDNHEGSVIMNAGTWNAAHHVYIGGQSTFTNATGSFEVNGGSLALSGTRNMYVGAGSADCQGILRVTGGSVEVNNLLVGSANTASGAVHLDGGVLTLNNTSAAGLQFLGSNHSMNISDGMLIWKTAGNIKSDDLLADVQAGRLTFSNVTRTQMEYAETDSGTSVLGTVGGATLWAHDDVNNQTTVWATIPEPATLGMISACGVFILISRRFFAT